LARILNALKIDFAILSPEERCLGDCEWLAGEHGLFEMLIERNIATLRKYRFREIITTDPHAYRPLRNVYPSMGGSFVVKPVVQFLAERLGQVKNLLESKMLWASAQRRSDAPSLLLFLRSRLPPRGSWVNQP